MKKNVLVWVFQVLMGILYLIEGVPKVISIPEVVVMFENWGYPYGFYLIIGGLELLGGFLLFHPKSAGYASIFLSVVMIGAMSTHIIHDEGLIVLRPIAYMIGLGVVFYYRFIEEMKKDDLEYFPLNKV